MSARAAAAHFGISRASVKKITIFSIPPRYRCTAEVKRPKLDGGAGNDQLTGGIGDDLYVVDDLNDQLVEIAGQGVDTVKSSVTWTFLAEFENLTLTGTSGLAATGNTLANAIVGNSGANAISALDGNDTITGAGGNDTTTGGLGADHFLFTNTSSGVDTITDFNELDGGGEEGDVLEFQGLLVGAFAYLGTGAFVVSAGHTQARIAGGQVLVDINGDAVADITINLTGLTTASQLATSDFLFS